MPAPTGILNWSPKPVAESDADSLRAALQATFDLEAELEGTGLTVRQRAALRSILPGVRRRMGWVIAALGG